MRTALAALLLASGATLAFAYPSDKQTTEGHFPQPVQQTAAYPAPNGDARSVASDREVGEARRAYRAQCVRHESRDFCECVTAGVAQALTPADVRLAARTIGERITAQGDIGAVSDSDAPEPGATPETRIAQVEGHYADVCHAYRR